MHCEGCGGYHFILLGTLGNTTYLRCCACGLDTSCDAEELDLEEETEEVD